MEDMDDNNDFFLLSQVIASIECKNNPVNEIPKPNSNQDLLMIIEAYKKIYSIHLKEEFIQNLIISGVLKVSNPKELNASEINIINKKINELELKDIINLQNNIPEENIIYTKKAYLFQIVSMLDIGNIKHEKKENKDFINLDFVEIIESDLFEIDEESAAYRNVRKHNPKKRMLKLLLRYGISNEYETFGFECEKLKVFDTLYEKNKDFFKNCSNLKIVLKPGVKTRKGAFYLKNKDVQLIL
jgi:hypothetical protein